jgi:hypothetical protein
MTDRMKKRLMLVAIVGGPVIVYVVGKLLVR